MRVCLAGSLNLSGWHEEELHAADVNIPLGLLSLASVLEQAGHSVTLIDWNHEAVEGRLPLNSDLYPTVVRRIEADKPDVVGFTSMCNSYHLTLRMAEAWKHAHPKVTVLLGGPQASVTDAETLQAFDFVDYILRGEAELTLPQFLAELQEGASEFRTSGLTWRGPAGIVQNALAALMPDLDDLPVPAYHLLPYSPSISGAIDAGRGCPFECTFCSTATYWGRRFRLKSIDRILEEMRLLRDKYGATNFSFQHDLFTLNQPRIAEFCARLKATGWPIKWACSARVDCVTPELLHTMAGAGCCAIFFGIETGSPRMQREIRKRLKLEQVWTAVDAAVAAGMTPTLSFIAGFPTETEEDLRQTVTMIGELMARPKVRVQGHLLGPERGTRDYAMYHDRLRFDGHYSDIAGTTYSLLEPQWFERYPGLFSSFHYLEPLHLTREMLRGLDLFVHGPCAILPDTVRQFSAAMGGLWPLYLSWKSWCAKREAGLGPHAGQRIDAFLMDFYEFAEELDDGSGRLNLGAARDEILSFYLRHYGEQPVRQVTPEQEAALSQASGG